MARVVAASVVAILLCWPAFATSAIKEIKSKEVVQLLSATTALYDGAKNSGFSLKVLYFKGDGECVSDKDCTKDKILFVTSSFDEYPDRSAFEVPVVGVFRRFEVITKPNQESDAFVVRLRLRTVMNQSKWVEYKIHLNSVDEVSECPLSASSPR